MSKNTVPHNSINNWTTDELIAVLGKPERIPNASGGTNLLWNSQPIVTHIDHYQRGSSINNWTTDELIAVLGKPERIPNASGGTSLLWNSQPIVKSIHYQLQ